MYRNKVKCYDCHEMVYNLRLHRKNCRNSRYAHSDMKTNYRRSNQRSTNFSHTTDYYILLDVSSSMTGNRLKTAKNTLEDVFNKFSENDRISIVTFDTNAYFKLKPRPVGQIRRQCELQQTLDRIFAEGFTAIWDAIHLTVSQVRDKNRKTVIVVLTDGEDNSSTHTYNEVMNLVSEYPNITLDIVHISNDNSSVNAYENICNGRGDYIVITEVELKVKYTEILLKRVLNENERI